jgi:hypothetical protein
MDRVFQQTYHVPGTLGANLAITFTAPFDMQLVHVSAVGSNTNNGILDIGNSSDADAYLDAVDIGDSHTPGEFDRDNFVDTQYPHIADGTVVKIALDYDGAGGTATADFTLVLTFTEG